MFGLNYAKRLQLVNIARPYIKVFTVKRGGLPRNNEIIIFESFSVLCDIRRHYTIYRYYKRAVWTFYYILKIIGSNNSMRIFIYFYSFIYLLQNYSAF